MLQFSFNNTFVHETNNTESVLTISLCNSLLTDGVSFKVPIKIKKTPRVREITLRTYDAIVDCVHCNPAD